jgi:hypothetical protein
VRYNAAGTRIEGEMNGDGIADFSIFLLGGATGLTAADFVFYA